RDQVRLEARAVRAGVAEHLDDLDLAVLRRERRSARDLQVIDAGHELLGRGGERERKQRQPGGEHHPAGMEAEACEHRGTPGVGSENENAGRGDGRRYRYCMDGRGVAADQPSSAVPASASAGTSSAGSPASAGAASPEASASGAAAPSAGTPSAGDSTVDGSATGSASGVTGAVGAAAGTGAAAATRSSAAGCRPSM